MRLPLAWLRSCIHMLWMLVTVVPWGIIMLVASLWRRGVPLYWMAARWLSWAIGGARLILADIDLEGLAETAREGAYVRYAAAGTEVGGIVDIRVAGGFPAGRMGGGSVHHIAFRAADDAAQDGRTRAFVGLLVELCARTGVQVLAGQLSLVGLGLIYALLTRERLQVNVLADRNPQFVVLSDGSIRNGYTVKLLNMIPEPRTFTVTLKNLPGGEMNVVGMDQQSESYFTVEVEPDKLKTLKVFVRQPRENVAGHRQHFKFEVEDRAGHESSHYEATFEAPDTSK